MRDASSCARPGVRLVTVQRRALPLQRARRQVRHLAGADDQHAPSLEAAEDLAREIDRATELTETGLRAIAAVSRRTRRDDLERARKARGSRIGPAVPDFSARSCVVFTWPRICGSPTTSESRLEATRNRWCTASESERT